MIVIILLQLMKCCNNLSSKKRFYARNMLSRRDKLLVQPWEDRRFKDHRLKVKLAQPAIDDRSPPPRPHVAMKLKKCQRELDRKAKIESDNFNLLQRLGAIMRVNRLDNHWTKPLPKDSSRSAGPTARAQNIILDARAKRSDRHSF